MSDVQRVPQAEVAGPDEALGEGAAGVLEPVIVPHARAGLGLTPAGRLRSGRLAGLSMTGAIWVLSWPVLVDSLLNSLVGLTDTVLAAAISTAATDAIGGASYIIWFVHLVIMALDVGATALVSRSVGAGRLAVANAAVGQTMLLALIAGTGMGLLTAAMTGPLAATMGLSEEAAGAFRVYLYIVAAGVPVAAILLASIACLRGAGDSLRPMTAMVVVNLVNIISSWIFAGADLTTTKVVGGEIVTRTILHNPFGFDMGVTGIAVGTVLAHSIGAAIMLAWLVRGAGGLRLIRRRLRPHLHTMRRLLRVGLPNFAETLGMWFGNFLIVLMVGWMGSEGYLGAHILAIRIEAFSFLPGFAMGMAAATLTGQYLGAGSPALARRAVLVCTGVAAAMMGAMGLLFVLGPTWLVGLFSGQPIHLEFTPDLLMIVGFVQVPFAVAIVLRSALRGAGDVKVVMWLTWTTTYAARLPLAYALSGVDIPVPAWLGGGVIQNPFPFDGGLAGLWIGLCIELVLRGGVFTARFVQGGWVRLRV